MGIAERQDRYKYLEDRIEENGGVEHLEESEEWFQLKSTKDKGIFDHPHWDKYMHRTRFFTATVWYKIKPVEEVEDGEVYETFATGEDTDLKDYVRIEPKSIKVNLVRPRHHYEYKDAEEELPPIHSSYTVDPAKE